MWLGAGSGRRTTIITPPTQTALTTAATVKGEVSNASGSAALRIPGLIEQASSIITAYLGRELARATVKDTFYGHHHHQSVLVLSRAPVATVDLVLAAGGLQDESSLNLDHATGVFHAFGHQVEIRRRLSAAGPGGANLPPAIERACIDITLALWHRSARGDPMIRSESIDGIGSTQYLDPLPGIARPCRRLRLRR
jgi:hypothetical protein